ncbi:helix-turn-helix domain-containing protein [Actinosynnema sp. CA-299493]
MRPYVDRRSRSVDEELYVPKVLVARLPIDVAEERAIRKLAGARHAPGDWIRRTRIVVASWKGGSTKDIAVEVGCHPQTVREWLHRFNTNGLDGLGDCSAVKHWPDRASPTPRRSTRPPDRPPQPSTPAQNLGSGVARRTNPGSCDAVLSTTFEERRTRQLGVLASCGAGPNRSRGAVLVLRLGAVGPGPAAARTRPQAQQERLGLRMQGWDAVRPSGPRAQRP